MERQQQTTESYSPVFALAGEDGDFWDLTIPPIENGLGRERLLSEFRGWLVEQAVPAEIWQVFGACDWRCKWRKSAEKMRTSLMNNRLRTRINWMRIRLPNRLARKQLVACAVRRPEPLEGPAHDYLYCLRTNLEPVE